jgi:NADPH2:quinone reductase
MGARVLTSAGSDGKVARGLDLGAEAGINYTSQDVRTELLRLTDERGVDVVVDPVGGAVYDATMQALAPGGRVVTIGGPAGPRQQADESALQAKNQSVKSMGVFNVALEDTEARGAARLNGWFEDGTIRPVVDRVLPMGEAAAAQRLLADRRIFGKVVLVWED